MMLGWRMKSLLDQSETLNSDPKPETLNPIYPNL